MNSWVKWRDGRVERDFGGNTTIADTAAGARRRKEIAQIATSGHALNVRRMRTGAPDQAC
jgi:hypothetical protein